MWFSVIYRQWYIFSPNLVVYFVIKSCYFFILVFGLLESQYVLLAGLFLERIF